MLRNKPLPNYVDKNNIYPDEFSGPTWQSKSSTSSPCPTDTTRQYTSVNDQKTTLRLVEQTLRPKVKDRSHRRRCRGWEGWRCGGELKGSQPLVGGREPRTQRREKDRLSHQGALCREEESPKHMTLKTRGTQFWEFSQLARLKA